MRKTNMNNKFIFYNDILYNHIYKSFYGEWNGILLIKCYIMYSYYIKLLYNYIKKAENWSFQKNRNMKKVWYQQKKSSN